MSEGHKGRLIQVMIDFAVANKAYNGPTLVAQGVSARLTRHILKSLLQNSNMHRHKPLLLSAKTAVFMFKLVT